ncbi:hypothetical protein QEN19_000840 [Hanseniaspora menglaensis]
MNTNERLILPVDIPNHVIRPIVYRIVTKQHNLLLTTKGLETIAYLIGRKAVGSDWRTTNLNYTKKVIDAIVRDWVKQGLGSKFDDREAIVSIYKGIFDAVPASIEPMEIDPGNSTSIQDITENTPNETSVLNITMDPEQEKDLIENYNQFIKFSSFYDQPLLRYDHLNRAFRLETNASEHDHKNVINPLLKSEILIQRLELLKHKYLKSINNSIKITPAKDLLGRNEELFTLFGIIRKNFKNEWILEDSSGFVKLVLSHLEYDDKKFFFFSGQAVILDGIYFTVGEEFQVAQVTFPKTETRGESILKRLNKMDYLGINRDNKYVLDEDFWIKLEEINLKLTRNWIVFLGGDLFLDSQSNLDKVDQILAKLDSDNISIPKFIVFQGSFTSKPLVMDVMANSKNVFKEYSDNFASLLQLISKYEHLKDAKTQFVFIPGDNDPWFDKNQIYPRDGIPSFIIKKQFFSNLISNCHFKSNPVRLIYLNQEILIVNHKYYKHFVTSNIQIENHNFNDESEENFIIDKLEMQSKENFKIANTIVTQQHLFPHENTLNWQYDHYLQLNPLPNSIVLADTSCMKYEVETNGVKVINLGRFDSSSDGSIGWCEYIPFNRAYVWAHL